MPPWWSSPWWWVLFCRCRWWSHDATTVVYSVVVGHVLALPLCWSADATTVVHSVVVGPVLMLPLVVP